MHIVCGVSNEATFILGSTIAISHDASNYSHSTVFMASASDDSYFKTMNVAPLTTLYTPPAECVNRWMLAGGQTVTTRYVSAVTTLNTTAVVPPVEKSATELWEIVTPIPGSITSALSTPALTSAALLPRQDVIAQNYTLLSMALNGTATDPSYRSCQKYNNEPTYSPGICPSGQTVAEITAWHVNGPSGYRTFWQASCCRRFVVAPIHRID